jgi:integrase
MTLEPCARRVQRSTRCHDREAAELVARQWERDASDPHYAAARQTTLTTALQLLLNTRTEQAHAGRRSHATVIFYRQKAGHLVRVFETDAQGNYVPFLLKCLEARHVDAYISQRRAEQASESSIHKELVALRVALKLARRAGLWFGEPAAICPIAFAPEYRPRTRALSRDELALLLGQLTPDKAARVAFIVATSACWHETELALREDVSNDRSYVLIRGTKRTTRYRTVPIFTPEQRSLLDFALQHADGDKGFLFWRWGNVRRDIQEACERAGIERCSPNDLRRTCAKWLRNAGATPDLIAPLMGHADTRMVERVYGWLTPAELGRRIAYAIGPETCSTFATNEVDNADLRGPAGRLEPRNPSELVRQIRSSCRECG